MIIEGRGLGGEKNKGHILPDFDPNTLLDTYKQLLEAAKKELSKLQIYGLINSDNKHGVNRVDSVIEYPIEIQKQINFLLRDIALYKSKILNLQKQKRNIN